MRLSLLPLALLPAVLAARIGIVRREEEPATFNGQTVPIQPSLTGETFNQTLARGYWMVEFFSPYCSHCKQFAPTWKTLYEFYYTQDPYARPRAGDSFGSYYDYHFGQVDCIAQGDTCNAAAVTQYPTIVLYRDGAEVERKVGGRDLKAMSQWIESELEAIHPGSRPKDLKLPNAGDISVQRTTMPGRSTTEMPLSGQLSAAGKSVQLTAETFQRKVTTTRDPWLVKFSVPGSREAATMAPSWQAMARHMRGRLNIGEVNCEAEKRLCRDVRAISYPTIIFFRGGERVQYHGLRGLGDLIDFANKAVSVGDGIQDVTAAQFEELEKKEDVIFLYCYDQATTSEDLAALERLVMSLIGHAKIVKANDAALNERFKISTWPRLLVSRDGKPSYYNGLSPRDMRDYRRLLNWMQSVWLPIVPELTASNANEIMRGKLVVLGILSRERPEEFASAKREIKNAALEWIDKQTQAFQLERQELRDAKQLRIEEAEDRNDQRALRAAKSIRINMDDIERKEVGFAWVDGVFWERWIRSTFGISVQHDNERVVMYEHDQHRYWDNTMTGNPIVPSRTSILETLPRAVSSPPKISPKRTTTALGHVWWVLRGQLTSHPLVSAGLVLAIAVAVFVSIRRLRPTTVPGEDLATANGLLGNWEKKD
ncbi:thioredoxin-like protein [Piedraia hortae CBS 480.64]|uniref:Thioredoxin-like protein n=1 Tax=Piedraia hortae CBS 480.64 TaxID=1314780 RepID=A0A6A7CA11_9PEZI|nr:thioredoxin-like protein [Piedraia hortae CBS 480.64]